MALFDKDRHIGIHGLGISPPTTWEHKQIIINITYALRNLFGVHYAIFSEWVVNSNDLTERQPDIVVFNKETREALVIAEITPKSHFKQSIEKIQEMMNDYASIEEGFVYDYEETQWHVIRSSGINEEPSYCRLLDIDFDCFIDFD